MRFFVMKTMQNFNRKKLTYSGADVILEYWYLPIGWNQVCDCWQKRFFEKVQISAALLTILMVKSVSFSELKIVFQDVTTELP